MEHNTKTNLQYWAIWAAFMIALFLWDVHHDDLDVWRKDPISAIIGNGLLSMLLMGLVGGLSMVIRDWRKSRIQRAKNTNANTPRRQVETNVPSTDSLPLTVNRANAIVAKVEGTYASGRFSLLDPYPVFQGAGASSRLEAYDALLISFADYYKEIAGAKPASQESLEKFKAYVDGSPTIYLAFDTETNGIFPEFSQKESPSSFIEFLQTLDPNRSDYWPDVYARIDRECSRGNIPISPALRTAL